MNEPAVLRFKAKLAPGGKPKSPGVLVELPATVAEKVAGLESLEGSINGHPFRAPLARRGDGDCSIRVNQAMLRGSDANVGDTVALAVLGPEPELVLAPDLRKAMRASAEATALWAEMSEVARRDYVRWVDGSKNPETRAKRIRRTVEQLAEGKKRPCCFNAYDYPMSIIDPDWLKKFKAKA